jgi:hypothetical protein
MIKAGRATNINRKEEYDEAIGIHLISNNYPFRASVISTLLYDTIFV